MNSENISAENIEDNAGVSLLLERGIEKTAINRDALSGAQWFDAYFTSYARAICNGCGAEISSAEMKDFFKNDGYCNRCNQ